MNDRNERKGGEGELLNSVKMHKNRLKTALEFKQLEFKETWKQIAPGSVLNPATFILSFLSFK